MIDNKKIKEHFSEKTTVLSENSWNKLEEMLNQEENKKVKKVYFFKYAMVACFFLIGFGFWFNLEDKTTFIPENEVVIEEQVKPIKILDNNNVIVKEVEKPNNVIIANNPLVNNKSIETKKTNEKIEKIEDKLNEVLPKEVVLENQIVDNNTNKITIENLNLKEEVVISNVKNLSKINIDSNLLLQAAEEDLNQEHKDITIKKIKSGYNLIKTYVNNVNYQNN